MWVTHPASWLLKCLNLAPLPGSLDHPEVLCISSIQALTQHHGLGSSSRLMRPPSGPLHFVTAVSPLLASLFLLSRRHDIRHQPPVADVLSSLPLQAHHSCTIIPQDDPTSTLPPVWSAAEGGLPIGASQTHGLQPRPGHTPSKHTSLSLALRQQRFLQTCPTLLKPPAQDPPPPSLSEPSLQPQ